MATTWADVRAEIMAAVHPDQYVQKGVFGGSYSNGANWYAKCLLEAASRDPQRFKAAVDAQREDPWSNSLYDLVLPEEREVLDRFGLTGFQAGWAQNAAARLTEQEALPNPAVLTGSPLAPAVGPEGATTPIQALAIALGKGTST